MRRSVERGWPPAACVWTGAYLLFFGLTVIVSGWWAIGMMPTFMMMWIKWSNYYRERRAGGNCD